MKSVDGTLIVVLLENLSLECEVYAAKRNCTTEEFFVLSVKMHFAMVRRRKTSIVTEV